MQNAQPTTNCAKWILKVDYLSISKQQKNFGVSKMQGRVTIGHMATRLFTGVSVSLTCQILLTFMSDGSVLQGEITKIPLTCELSTISFLTPEMLSFNLVYNT